MLAVRSCMLSCLCTFLRIPFLPQIKFSLLGQAIYVCEWGEIKADYVPQSTFPSVCVWGFKLVKKKKIWHWPIWFQIRPDWSIIWNWNLWWPHYWTEVTPCHCFLFSSPLGCLCPPHFCLFFPSIYWLFESIEMLLPTSTQIKIATFHPYLNFSNKYFHDWFYMPLAIYGIPCEQPQSHPIVILYSFHWTILWGLDETIWKFCRDRLWLQL